MTDTRNIGQQAEKEACLFLESKGLTLLIRNYHSPFGEIDLIMRDKNDIVFVEVRKRTHCHFANALESVILSKQKKLIKTAMHYLQKQKWLNKINCRFDVVGISHNKIEWLQNAFLAENF